MIGSRKISFFATRLDTRQPCYDSATTSLTTRLTRGSTISSVGKAISHERPQAGSQWQTKPAENPTAFRVEISDTTKVMMIDRIKGRANAP